MLLVAVLKVQAGLPVLPKPVEDAVGQHPREFDLVLKNWEIEAYNRQLSMVWVDGTIAFVLYVLSGIACGWLLRSSWKTGRLSAVVLIIIMVGLAINAVISRNTELVIISAP